MPHPSWVFVFLIPQILLFISIISLGLSLKEKAKSPSFFFLVETSI